MGTRADFYVGLGKDAEWIGSIAWDGYPDGTPCELAKATTESAFREKCAAAIAEDSGTTPDMGWPWPWDDSHTTDFAYCFSEGKVWPFCFGEAYTGPDDDGGAQGEFPDMSARKNVTFGPRSGLIILRGPA